MAINFDKAFGLHPQGMQIRAKRAELIASNIANADTPGYKAQGMDFQKVLAQASQKLNSTGMSRTNEKHFDIRMELNNGVGYRVKVSGANLELSLGYSHPINYKLPDGVTAEAPTNTELVLTSTNKQLLGDTASEIRAFRPPEPYKGKGVKYSDEHIKRKESKKTA